MESPQRDPPERKIELSASSEKAYNRRLAQIIQRRRGWIGQEHVLRLVHSAYSLPADKREAIRSEQRIRRPMAGNYRYNHPLLTESQRDRIEIVLVSPRNPLNIGAAARARLANFGFTHLNVVAPYEPHWREAKSAIGAEGAPAKREVSRSPLRCPLPALHPGYWDRDACRSSAGAAGPPPTLPCPSPRRGADRDGCAALVFGPEKRGLTRDDLAMCHILVEIPTHPSQPSMNLGQAVAVCLYELAARSPGTPLQEETLLPPDTGAAPASMHDLDLLAEVVANTMQAADYSPAAMQRGQPPRSGPSPAPPLPYPR